jgi:hypothetical protein
MKSKLIIENLKPIVKKVENNNFQFNNNNGIIASTEISELQGSLQELNNDKVDMTNRTSGIDLRTRLYNTEISSIIVVDTLVAFNFLPMSVVPFTLQKKRLAVSLMGKGRDEIVDLVRGKKENDLKSGTSLFGSMFKKKDDNMGGGGV